MHLTKPANFGWKSACRLVPPTATIIRPHRPYYICRCGLLSPTQ